MSNLMKRLNTLTEKISSTFTAGDWETIGLMTGYSEYFKAHDRLYRSLHWNDPDYPDCVRQVIAKIAGEAPSKLDDIEEYINSKAGLEGRDLALDQPTHGKIVVRPSAFRFPVDAKIEKDLVAVMMPFAGFDAVYSSLQLACEDVGFRCQRADEIWGHAVIMDDIASLIFRAAVVISDYTGKNPNVMYETGIAHTIGKNVLPITQKLEDGPSDTRHHRALIYLANGEGLQKLRVDVARKLREGFK